jgi:uncharacterized protein YbjT (DUF2867 family)
MRATIFGATGMIGQGVLRECLLDAGVVQVLSVGRTATGVTHPKLRELVRPDLFDLAPVQHELPGYDACFYCLGVSSVGMTERDYRRITYDLTIEVAQQLLRQNPAMTFIYVSGAGTDSTEHGRVMWARVKGETENALMRLPFKAAVMFRPAGVVPMHGVRSKTRLYRAAYAVTRPLWPLLYAAFPRYVTTTEQIGRAMIRVVRNGAPNAVLESADINRV